MKNFIKSIGLLVLPALMMAGGLHFTIASADRFDRKINALAQENNEAREEVRELEVREASLSATIAGLQAKISGLEKQIRQNEAKRAQLKRKIAETQAEIEKQKSVLGQSIKAMYVEGDISTFEMLASSQNLSEFVDKQQYRESVQNKIKTMLDKIKALQAELKKQEQTVQKLLADQKEMQSELAAQRAENNRLLGLNQNQQADFEQDIRSNNSKIAELRRLQAIENARHFSGGWQTGGTGGYPWANVPFPNTMSDPWGMYKRQCVSYTAWKVASTGRHMPYWGGRGNAKLWDDNARRAGIPVSYSPRVGDVAVSNAGTYGHVMYVEAVHGDGTITISQYNAGWDGRYSVGRRSTAGLVFIHF